MALTKSVYELNTGLVLNNVYVRIDTISGNKSELSIDVKVYVNQEHYNNGKACVDSNSYNFTPNVNEDALNYHKQAYLYLKTLDEYANAIDC